MTRTRARIACRPRPVSGFAFRIARHDIRSTLPSAIQGIVQNGMLNRAFYDALVPEFLFPNLADSEPWGSRIGDTGTFTRAGLLAPVTVAITGSDASANTYGFEQFSVTMDQYANSVDTNLLQSEVALASKFLEDAQTLGINAGQSLNLLARTRLMAAYRGGNTFLAATATSVTQVVNDASGFDKVLVNGTPQNVSVGNPLAVTVNGVANTVTGCVLATNTLTFGTSVTGTAGFAVVAGNAPTVIRPNARASAFTLTSGDVATFAAFRSAVSTLRQNKVPGPYTAHLDAVVEAELFGDTEFKQLYQGRADLPQWRDQAIGRFGGIDWIRNTESETIGTAGASGTLTAHRTIVCGSGVLTSAPLAGFKDMQKQVAGPIGHVEIVNVAHGLDVAFIIRPPQDRLQQVVAQTWSWVGDFGVPSDYLTPVGSATARYKRGVVVETA